MKTRLDTLQNDPYIEDGVVHISNATLHCGWSPPWAKGRAISFVCIDYGCVNKFKLNEFVGVIWRAGNVIRDDDYNKSPTKTNCFPVVKDPDVPEGKAKLVCYNGTEVTFDL